jgi:putative transposase
MSKETPARKPYPSDLTDAQGTILEPLIPTAHTQHGGRPREVDTRAVVNTLL